MSELGEVSGVTPHVGTAVGEVRQPTEVRLSLLDRALDAISPRLGAQRYLLRLQQARMERMMASYGYVGGRTDRKSMKEWRPAAGSAVADLAGQDMTLRARSRDLVRNSPVAAGAIGTSEMNVVGTGVKLSAEIDADYLGMSAEQAADKQNELERLWRMTKDRLEYEGDSTQSMLQSIVLRSVLESGDVLVIRRRRQDPGDLIPLKVQLLEADRISNPNNVWDTQRIAGGVQVSRSGRTEGYHVTNVHPGDLLLQEVTSWNFVPKYGRGGLALSRLIFSKGRPGQRRGVPLLAPVMEPLKQITRLTDYELMSSVVASMFTVFVKSEQPTTGQLPVVPVGETSVPDPGEIYMPGGGSVIDLKPGEDIVTADPNRPNGAFAPFFQALVEQIGMAIQIPYEVLMHRYQNSYSAARAAVLDAHKFWENRRNFLAEQFLSLEYEWVLQEAVVNGVIDLPGFLTDPMARQAWLGATWMGPGKSQINPKDDVEAAKARVEAGFSTRKLETAQLMGLDWDKDIQPQREREKAILEAADMGFSTESANATPVMEPASEDDDGSAPPDEGGSDEEEEAA